MWSDAVVRVQSGGADGAIALYVFSTDMGREAAGLRVVFRSQELRRAETRVRDGVLRYRSARPQPRRFPPSRNPAFPATSMSPGMGSSLPRRPSVPLLSG